MKRNSFIFLFLLFSFYACNNNDKQASGKAEDDIDAAREFIRSALDGKFGEARTYLLSDSINMQYLDAVERNYQKQQPETINDYHQASINIHEVRPVNDSTTIVIYSNSFKNDHDTLKVLKVKGQWLIDLKYLYEHDMDTTHIFNNRDTLK
jgi:Domain of unknown function (DUF4878)